MALGNWDHISFSEAGKPIQGIFRSKEGVEVELYKNWLSILDKKAWRRKSGFIKPVVMEISYGAFRYKDVSFLVDRLYSFRRNKRAMFFAVWSEDYPEKGDPIVKGMIGIGCLTSDKGIEPYQLARLDELRKKWADEDFYNKKTKRWNGGFYDAVVSRLPTVFIQFPLSPKASYNQGGLFLANALKHNWIGKNVSKKPAPRNKIYK